MEKSANLPSARLLKWSFGDRRTAKTVVISVCCVEDSVTHQGLSANHNFNRSIGVYLMSVTHQGLSANHNGQC